MDTPQVSLIIHYLFPSFIPLSVESFFDSLTRLNRLAPGKPETQKVGQQSTAIYSLHPITSFHTLYTYIMCGIFCCYNRSGDLASFRPRAIALSKKQRHRGPDWSGCYMGKDTVMVHERLAIVGVGESLISHP